jgi:hypothetical protein
MPMGGDLLAAIITSGIIILGGLLRITLQAGRIEMKVEALSDRLDRVEGWQDRNE